MEQGTTNEEVSERGSGATAESVVNAAEAENDNNFDHSECEELEYEDEQGEREHGEGPEEAGP